MALEPEAIGGGSARSHYRHSGEFGVSGVLMGLAGGAATAAILAIPYSYAAVYIPIAFFIVPFVFGGAVGYVTALGAKHGKVRNAAVVLLLGIVAGAVAEYAGWVFWILAFSRHELFVLNPLAILDVMQSIAPKGAWSLRGFTPTGAVLWGLWALEAVVLMGTSAMVAAGMNRSLVFCEQCRKWCERIKRIGPLAALDRSLLRTLASRLEKGDFSALLALKKVSPTSKSYTAIEILGCDSCRGQSYLTVKSVTVGKDEDGDREKNETDVVDRLAIGADVRDQLMALSAATSVADLPPAGTPAGGRKG